LIFRNFSRIFFLFIFAFCFFNSLLQPKQVIAEERAHKVAATIPILAGIIKKIVGEDIEVVSVLEGMRDPHAFEPKPSDGFRIRGSQMIIGIGGGFDAWAFTIFRQESSSKDKNCESFFIIDVLKDEHRAQLIYRNKQLDPHIWLDPLFVSHAMLPAISEGLTKCFLDKAPVFKQNLLEFQEELSTLDKELTKMFVDLKDSRFFAIHSALAYFARRYGLVEIADRHAHSLENVSLHRFAALVRMARDENVKVIISQGREDLQVAKKVAKEINGNVVIIDNVGRSSEEKLPNYLVELKKAAQTLSNALRDG
jgi:ABC-type Zn uptake system ZnuABC Zn-binding protein ZnuA